MESPAVEAKTVSGIATSNDDDSDNSSKGASSLTVHEEEGEQSGEEEVSIVLRLHLIANIQDLLIGGLQDRKCRRRKNQET